MKIRKAVGLALFRHGLGMRRILILGILVAGIWAFSELQLKPTDLVPTPGGALSEPVTCSCETSG